jgi:hypothetical protein
MKIAMSLIAGSALLATSAFAQTPPSSTRTTNAPAVSTPAPMMTTPGAATTTTPNATMPNATMTPGTTAATSPSAPMNQTATAPVSGSNSFTLGEARSRLASNGYTNISGLKKDAHGVWRGKAKKDGSGVNVWLDYKGNMGQS